jgi:hypothetical protein
LNQTRGHNQAYYQAVSRNIFLNEQFLEIVNAFSKQNIKVMPLKGIALIQGIYTDISKRYLQDIDILVKPQDIYPGLRILSDLGYVYPKIYLNPKSPYGIYLNSVSCARPSQDSYSIHLHWHILNTTLPFFMFRIKMDAIWAEARMEKPEKANFFMMAPHHLLIHFSLHAFQHSFDRDAMVLDIKNAIEFYNKDICWERSVLCAKQWDTVIPFYLGLYFSWCIAGADIPSEIIESLKPKKLSRKSKKAIEVILKNKTGGDNTLYPLFLELAGSLFNRSKFVFLSLFPPPSELAKTHQVDNWIVIFLLYFRRAWCGMAQSSRFFSRK